MAKKMDIELLVDVTEDLGLEVTGRAQGMNVKGKATNKAWTMVAKFIGNTIVEAMSKSNKEEADNLEIKEEDVTTEEVIEETITEEV